MFSILNQPNTTINTTTNGVELENQQRILINGLHHDNVGIEAYIDLLIAMHKSFYA